MDKLTQLIISNEPQWFKQMSFQQLVRLETSGNLNDLHAEVMVTVAYDPPPSFLHPSDWGSLDKHVSLLVAHGVPITNLQDRSDTLSDENYWANVYTNNKKYSGVEMELRRMERGFYFRGPQNNERVSYPFGDDGNSKMGRTYPIQSVDGSKLSKEDSGDLSVVRYGGLAFHQPHILRYSFETKEGIERIRGNEAIMLLQGLGRDRLEELLYSLIYGKYFGFKEINYDKTPADFNLAVFAPIIDGITTLPLPDGRLRDWSSSFQIDNQRYFVNSYYPKTASEDFLIGIRVIDTGTSQVSAR